MKPRLILLRSPRWPERRDAALLFRAMQEQRPTVRRDAELEEWQARRQERKAA